MSMHWEWDTATTAAVAVMDAETANEDLQPDDEPVTDHALVLGGDAGGGLVITGTLDELDQLVGRIAAALDGAHRATGHPRHLRGAPVVRKGPDESEATS